MNATTALPVTLGLMTWGEPGSDGARVTDIKDCEKILEVFVSHGHNEVDTALVYAGGTSEQYLGKIDYKKLGILVDTKLYPHPMAGTSHSAADLRKWINIELKSLNATSMEIFYLHAPDRKTPFEETFKTIDELHKEGLFKRFGISNFMAWEVAHVVSLCEKNGWIKPTVYQGLYNAIHRQVEPELFPCLRKLGLSFYAFNPLAGGFFTGRYNAIDQAVEPGSRFDLNQMRGKANRSRYWNESYFEALDIVKPLAEKHNLTLAEIALRWISHHSLLKRELGDTVLIGASSIAHLQQNLVDLEKGPLPEDVVKALDDAWAHVKPVSTPYYH